MYRGIYLLFIILIFGCDKNITRNNPVINKPKDPVAPTVNEETCEKDLRMVWLNNGCVLINSLEDVPVIESNQHPLATREYLKARQDYEIDSIFPRKIKEIIVTDYDLKVPALVQGDKIYIENGKTYRELFKLAFSRDYLYDGTYNIKYTTFEGGGYEEILKFRKVVESYNKQTGGSNIPYVTFYLSGAEIEKDYWIGNSSQAPLVFINTIKINVELLTKIIERIQKGETDA